jgi:hypothetical protein
MERGIQMPNPVAVTFDKADEAGEIREAAPDVPLATLKA